MKEPTHIEVGKTEVRSSQRRTMLTGAILTAIALVGLALIIGWHLRVRLLVQIIPGVIPMQYNTALCFVVLGLSGWLLITRRCYRFLPVLGAAFLIVMGALVIYEYASGISLGVDTLLFYPWDVTLLKYPGRMALTSAVSFISSGIALILFSLRRQALASFAILHTLPLSLGLTSALGYMAGITFVLPFQLGSQMAIHTAVAFSAYGGVMLVYAWQEAPHTEQGIPKWAPAIGVLMLPILSVGIGVTAHRNSALGWAVPFFAGLLAATLFAFAAYKLRNSCINQKGLILVSVPLVFVLLFVVFVTQMSRQSEQAQAAYLHSKEVISWTESIFNDLVDAEASIRGYVLTGDPAFAEPFQRVRQVLPKEIEKLQDLLKDDPTQQIRASKLSSKAVEKISFLTDTQELMRSGARDQAVERVKTAKGLQLMNEFRLAREDFLKEEQRLDLERHAAVQNAWQRFNWLLVAGSSIDIFLAVVLAALFSGGISKRIVALTENARALAEGKPLLTQPMKGTDEIAHLDQVFREMAQALKEAARKERAIFENALDIVCSTDGEGRFLKMSPSSLNIWGYQPEEMIGRNFSEFLVSEDIEKSQAASSALPNGQVLTDFENRYRRKDGSVIEMLWSAWWSDTDNVVFAMARDITERKRSEAALRESEERYRLLFEGNPHPIWVFDLETLAFLAVNQAAVLRYGYSREEFLGMTIKDIRPAEDVLALLANVSTADPDESTSGPWRHRKKDGEIIDVEIASHQLVFAGRNAEIVLANDITERKQAEDAINHLNKNLEARGQQLEQANKELEAFSYSVSHDLRAPLRAIDGFSRILLEDYSDKLDEDGNRVLEVVRKNAQNMGQLIDDLLAFSRLGRKAVEPTPIDMTDMAKSVYEELKAFNSAHPAQLRIHDTPSASGDRTLIRQVFVNLLSNATKYSRKKKRPLIEIGGRTENGNNIYYVKDNGAGFDMQYANKLFGVFQRLHGPEEFEGTGVGLAIVQRIIHRHGGKVWAEGKVNEGATFYFTLPRKDEINGKLTKPE